MKFLKFEIKKDSEVCRANISYEAAEDSTVYIFHVDFEILQQLSDVLVNNFTKRVIGRRLARGGDLEIKTPLV